MRGQRITKTDAAAPARNAVIAWLAAAALLGPAAPARAGPDLPAPATPGQAAPQLGLTLHTTGVVVAQLALEVPADAAHRCALPNTPGAAYQLSFGKAPGVALLDPAHPGLIISVAGRPEAASARAAGSADIPGPAASPDQASRPETGDAADEPSVDASDESAIQLSIGGRRFIGIGSMDPEYHLAVTLSADGQRGSFTARHLVDASGNGAVDASGTWRCPASGIAPADAQVRDVQRTGSQMPEVLPEASMAANTAPSGATSLGITSEDAAASDPPARPQPPAPDNSIPDDLSNSDEATGRGLRPSPAASAAVPRGTTTGPARASDAGLLGNATGLLVPQRQRGRPSRRVAVPVLGCTSTTTLDGVSAALQAGPFGRRQNLSIMQFRNVVTDAALDGRVACHADVVLSDDSLHRAEYGLRSEGRRTRVHIQVARERLGTAAIGGEALPEHSTPDPSPGRPETPRPAT